MNPSPNFKYHHLITDGQFTGSYTRTLIPRSIINILFGDQFPSETENEAMKEAIEMQKDGHSLVFYDPKGDSESINQINQLVKKLSRDHETREPNN